MKKGLTEIICILDRSGSMSSIIRDSIGGFNSFLKSQKEQPGEAKVSIVFFDHEYNLFENAIDINKIKDLNSKTYVPRGNTALLDAIGTTINTIGERIQNEKEEDRPEKVLVAILTDGEENSSTKFTKEIITKMIEHQKSHYKWDFVFLAANQDAIQAGAGIGINANSCFNYQANAVGTRSAYDNLATYSSNFRSNSN